MSLNLEAVTKAFGSGEPEIRYRLVRTLRRGHSFAHYAWGLKAATDAAQRIFEEEETPVLVCESPPGGITRGLFVVGKIEPKPKRQQEGKK